MKRKREEQSPKEKAFDTSRVFTSFEEIVKVFLMICISFQISRHVASLIWGQIQVFSTLFLTTMNNSKLFERLLFIAYFHPILSIKSDHALDHVLENYSIFANALASAQSYCIFFFFSSSYHFFRVNFLTGIFCLKHRNTLIA